MGIESNGNGSSTNNASASKPVTRADKVNADITALLKARHTLLWVVTREEMRVERAIIEAAAAAKFNTLLWDCATGLQEPSGRVRTQIQDPQGMLNLIKDAPERAVYVLRDLHKWLDPIVLRSLRNRAREMQSLPPEKMRAIVVLTPSAEVPPELAGHATVIDYPIPDRPEMARILDSVIAVLPEDMRAKMVPNGVREAAIDAAVGLTAEEAANCYSKSLVTAKRIDPAIVSAEKRRVIAREKVLTWYEPDPRGLDGVGGLDVLKDWLRARKSAFSERARAYGLPAPKGCMLVGVPGCGKSLTAKCIASAWGVPLLRLDLGALRSKFVGESEANIRKALQVAESCSPCVLWLDEIEKALAGSTGEQGDGGVSADALGAVLSWMQERQGNVFVIATANDVRALPPELLRKGRFDEVFWVDLPTAEERRAIASAAIKSHGRNPETFALDSIALATEGFAGVEVAELIPCALFTAFADGEREPTTDDILSAAKDVVPLAKTASEKIDALRTWAKGRARLASRVEKRDTNAGRVLDLS